MQAPKASKSDLDHRTQRITDHGLFPWAVTLLLTGLGGLVIWLVLR